MLCSTTAAAAEDGAAVADEGADNEERRAAPSQSGAEPGNEEGWPLMMGDNDNSDDNAISG